MTPLLNSLESCALFVDPRKQHLEWLPAPSQHRLNLVFRLLSDAISAASVPCHVVVAEPNRHHQELLFTPVAHDHHVHVTPAAGTMWSSSGLATALAAKSRPNLAICGFWLETHVSFLALSAVSAGFDVFLLTDATPPRVETTHEAAIARLVQAGVVPTSSSQLFAEWREQSSDPTLRAGLTALLE